MSSCGLIRTEQMRLLSIFIGASGACMSRLAHNTCHGLIVVPLIPVVQGVHHILSREVAHRAWMYEAVILYEWKSR